MRPIQNPVVDVGNYRKDEKGMDDDQQKIRTIMKEVTYIISCTFIILSYFMIKYYSDLQKLNWTAIYLLMILGSVVLSVYSLVDLKILRRRISDITYILSMLLIVAIYLVMFLYRPEPPKGWSSLNLILTILCFILVVISSIISSKVDNVIQWKKICISLMLLIVPTFLLVMSYLFSLAFK